MAKVSVNLNGRAFTIGCEEGQEAYLRELAEGLDARVRDLAGQVGQIGDLRLLLMAALVVADELKDAQRRAAAAEALAERVDREGRGVQARIADERAELAERMIKAAERLEALAELTETRPDSPETEESSPRTAGAGA